MTSYLTKEFNLSFYLYYYYYRQDEGDMRVLIDYDKFQSVYEQKQNSNGLALFVQFDTHYDAKSWCNKICDQMEVLRQFSFDFEIICAPEHKDRNKEFSGQFEQALSTIESNGYKIIIVFLIGLTAPIKIAHGELAYFISEGENSTKLTYPNEIHEHINKNLSKMSNAIPALIFHTWILPDIHCSHQEHYASLDTFYCFVSHKMNPLSQDVHLLPFIRSLYEVLKYSPNETILLMEFFTEIRDHYFKFFSPNVCDCYDSNIILFSKNTLRYPLVIKNKTITSMRTDEYNSMRISDGLFFIIGCNTLFEGKWEGMIGLIEHIKRLFEAINYTIGEDVMLWNIQGFSQALLFNNDIAKNCRYVFVLIITSCNRDNDITFADGSVMGVDRFAYEIGIAFPGLPKVLFFNKVSGSYEVSQATKIQEYQHMLVVHSFERNLSNSSLISNFLFEIQNNYYDELHSILRSSIMKSTQSTFIQVIDGLRKNIFNNHHSLLASLLTQNVKEFSNNYEKACLKGVEPFNFSNLMLVGPKGVGKTSLFRLLIGQPFNANEESTNFSVKYNMKLHKQSNDWLNVGNLYEYLQNIEEIRQELVFKNIARKMFKFQQGTKPEKQSQGQESSKRSSYFNKQQSIEIFSQFDPNLTIVKPSKNLKPGQFNEKQSLQLTMRHFSYKSEMITAWDFPGSNELSCFYPLFLAPRSVYLLLIDLTKNLDDMVELGEDDRIQRRSKFLPKTYLDVYTFWLNAIWSASKTSAKEHHNNKTKIIVVFNKADGIDNPENLARLYLNDLRVHMQNKSDAFSLVHKEDGLFLLSCKRRSKMDMETIFKLKIIVKHLSDQVAYSVPIPIKWLKLASDILKQPILDNSSIHYLAENSQCSEDLPRILEYFHEIGLFFYKQGILIIDIQILLDLIYHIIYPPFDHKQVNIDTDKLKISKKDIQHFMDEGKLYLNLFEYIVGEYLNLRSVREPLLELLQLFGILIKCEPKWGILTSFHVPYLQLDSLDNLLQLFPKKILCSRYIINFLDGFQSTSLYFTILSECSKRNEAYQLSSSKIGFDCAIFYISDSLTVSFDFLTILNNILLSFFLYESALYQDEYVNSEILNYLTFLQFTLVKIQNTLIPCGSLAKVIALCDTCSTLSSLQLEEKPICTLDTLFLTISNVYSICFDQSDAEDLQTINIQNISDNLPWIKGQFCCESQFERVFKCFYRKDPLFVVIYNSYYNSDLEDFIKKNHEVFTRYLNWKKLARLLYSHLPKVVVQVKFPLIFLRIYLLIIESTH